MNDILLPQVLIDAVNEELAKNESCGTPKANNIRSIASKTSWVGNDQTVVNPGDTIKLNWSHKASEALGKVKSVDFHNGEYLTVDLVTTASGRKWIDEVKDYIFKEENRYRTQCLNLPATVIEQKIKEGRNIIDFDADDVEIATEQDFDRFFLRKRYEPCWEVRTSEEQRQYELERDAIDACRYAFENLKLSLRSAQDREIAKYSVKDKSELMTPYDIWEQNKKGELPMNTYDITYNEKKAAAQKAYDEAMLAAKKEKEEAAQKEANETAAKTLKGMYDAYVNAGFTPEQAEKFVTIALEKVASKI